MLASKYIQDPGMGGEEALVTMEQKRLKNSVAAFPQYS